MSRAFRLSLVPDCQWKIDNAVQSRLNQCLENWVSDFNTESLSGQIDVGLIRGARGHETGMDRMLRY